MNRKKSFIYIFSGILLLISLYFIFQLMQPYFQASKTPPFETTQQSPIPQTNTPTPQTNSIKPKEIKTVLPTPTPDPQTYACGAGGVCNSYLDPQSADCPITFKDRYCQNKCDDPTLRCRF
jgi:hypothetical protein